MLIVSVPREMATRFIMWWNRVHPVWIRSYDIYADGSQDVSLYLDIDLEERTYYPNESREFAVILSEAVYQRKKG